MHNTYKYLHILPYTCKYCVCQYILVFFRIRQYASGTDLECIISSVPVPTGMAQRPSCTVTCSRTSATQVYK